MSTSILLLQKQNLKSEMKIVLHINPEKKEAEIIENEWDQVN